MKPFLATCVAGPLLAAPAAFADDNPGLPEPLRGQDYRLVFHDEFDGPKNAPPDPKAWTPRMTGKWRDGWNVEECASLDGEGHLRLETRKNGDRFETGYIGTDGRFEATHGYWECRCQVQKTVGFWSAFWIQSNSLGNPMGDGVRAGVEIDVMEYLTRDGYKDKAMHTAHWDGYAKEHHKTEHVEKKIPGLGQGFHTFAVKWDEAGYVFYTDGAETGRWKKAPISCRPEYIILSCEIGTWAGDIKTAQLPDAFVVDWVRVWQTPAQVAADQVRAAAKQARGAAKKAQSNADKALAKAAQTAGDAKTAALAELLKAGQEAAAARQRAEQTGKAEEDQLKRTLATIDQLAKEAEVKADKAHKPRLAEEKAKREQK